MSTEEMQQILHHLLEEHPELDIINFTGGEPTLHPQLLEFLQMCHDAGIGRLTISTNGLKLLDEDYTRRLAALDARVILSLDTFRAEVDHALLGANTVEHKLKVLDLLEKHDVTGPLLPAVAAGYNDDEIGQLLDLVLKRPNLCSLELHTLTFTGQGGTGFNRSGRITSPDLHRRIEEATEGKIRAEVRSTSLRSHQSGRDVDIDYFYRRCREVCGHHRISPEELDADRQWRLLEAWVREESVEYVFIDHAVQEPLYEAARRAGASRTDLSHWFQWPRAANVRFGVIRHVPSHADHMHVRFACAPHDTSCVRSDGRDPRHE